MILIGLGTAKNVSFFQLLVPVSVYAMRCNNTAPFTVMLSLCAVHIIATFATFFSKFVGVYPFEFFLVARFFVGGE